MYATNISNRGPIAFGEGFGRAARKARGLGDATSYPTSAIPNPPSLVAAPSAQLVQPPWSTNPLQFVSPQQAIASGLDPTAVYAAWSNRVNSYPSSQAAVNAGIAPATVTELWTGGNPPAAKKNYAPLFLALGGAAVLAFLGQWQKLGSKEAR